jgi:predicted unusual protein kinase regulating ubiquinone biosynthesis (AarF/ABC1/UbiB family)
MTSSSNPVWSPWSWFSEFIQPINPGWTFGNLTINEQNSSAPDTERDIVAVDSYGRQLGHIIDALAVLIQEQPQWTRKPAFEQLITMRAKIEQIKARSAARRLDRIAADIVELRNNDKSEYRRLVEKLQKALADEDRLPV